ncbi:MAG: MFS transporter [Canibacter sp.]
MTHAPGTAQSGNARKAGAAAFVGTTIEWYDFYAYATAAAVVFPHVFFPEDDPVLANMASLGLFAAAFLVRPFGGVVFGAIGDRIGRRPTLIMTLSLVGIATALVGVMPSYDSWGIAAPILLLILRACQGLAVGGEWGGAALLSVESAPEGKKFFYGGFTQLGNPAGAMLATGVFALVSVPDENGVTSFLLDWGWRIPFWLSVPLVIAGLIVRLRAEESPVFEEKVAGRQQSNAFVFAVKNNWLPILLGAGMMTIASGGYSLATTWVQNYGASTGVSATHLLWAMTIASFLELIVTLPLAWLSDKVTGKKIMYFGLATSSIVFIPLVLLLDNKFLIFIYILVSVVRLAMSATYSPLAGIIAQMFRPQSRYTSVSLSYGLGAAVWGGLTPLMATALINLTGSPLSVVFFYIVLAAIAWVSTYFAPQHSDAAPVTQSFTPRMDTTLLTTEEKSD